MATVLPLLFGLALVALSVITRARSRASQTAAELAARASQAGTMTAPPAAAVAAPPAQPPAAPAPRRAAVIPPPAAPPRLRVETLFGSAQSLTAAFVAAEIIQPPVALRPEGFSPRAKR